MKLSNGEIYEMKDLPLGSILENGSKVFAVMKINNSGENLYKIKGGVNNEDIYVTGSHFIFEKDQKKFIRVEESKHSVLVNEEITWYSSLITTNNLITIGDHIFWDWEDDCLLENK